ncbi:MAG: hypothetical protein ACE5FN_03820 [Leptospirillia bacterium]
MRLIILVGLLLLTLWLIARSLNRSGGAGGRINSDGSKHPLVQDPVCKTFIPKETAVVTRTAGVEHYFCSDECARAFERGEGA